jgi:hypothetical protein
MKLSRKGGVDMSQEKGRILMRTKNTMLVFLGGFITAGILILGIMQKIMSCCSDSRSEAKK